MGLAEQSDDTFDLDDLCCAREGDAMSKTPLLAAAASAALFVLSACQQGAPEMVNAYDPQEEALKNAAPVQLPPAVTESRTYRCSDNSLYYVDFYNNNTATLRTRQDGPTTMLTAEGGAPPYHGGAYTVSGSGTTTNINGKSCHT
jgi:hypothetical protein